MEKWNDTFIDSAFYLLLQDLTTLLTGNPSFTFDYSYGSFIDIANKEVTGSSLWDEPRVDVKRAGYKTDVFLRTLGTMHESDIPALIEYFHVLQDVTLSRFSSQLVTVLEDIRLEEIIRKKRPGTKRDFTIRKQTMKHYFYSQLKVNVTRGLPLDELFCLIFLSLHADEPDPDFSFATKKQLGQLEMIKPHLFDCFTATHTRDITSIAKRIIFMLDDYHDLSNEYVTFPISDLDKITKNTLFDELTRTDPLANDDQEDVEQDKSELFDESFSTWHRENENSDRKQNLLQFELDVGTKTDLIGSGMRETEQGDQAMASVQGSSGKSDYHDFSDMEALTKEESELKKGSGAATYGWENRHAISKVKEATTPSNQDKELYKKYVEEIDPYRRKLATTIEKVIEHKRNAPHKNLVYGRLSKNILPLIMDDNPRVFYKKTSVSKNVDAAFTLLVDCSSSMHNKMMETKRGIILFHEVLNQLHIPHSIVGFWEDASGGTDTYYPNYFHYVHRFQDTGRKKVDAAIMQLNAEEDNRDGYSIRMMTEALVQRKEKNKFLLVFTDGEPAAMNYDKNGIVDTNVAVAESRRRGIDVIGVFLAEGEITERDAAMMRNIYGKEQLLIPNIAELPDHFAILLKKLLLRGI